MTDYADVLRRRLHDLCAVDDREQTLRLALAIEGLRGIASTIHTVPAIDGFNPQGVAAALNILADDFERIQLCIDLSAYTAHQAA